MSGLHIQPFGGGLRAIVPAPSGILANGEGTCGAVGERVVEADLADLGGEVGVAGDAGEIGFILNPLMPCVWAAVALGGGGWVAGGGPGIATRGVGGRTFSRCVCKYAAPSAGVGDSVLVSIAEGAGTVEDRGGTGKATEVWASS